MREGLDRRRTERRRPEGSILGAAAGHPVYWSVAAFDAGHREGASAVASHDSSSAGTGYGSSGGSFSGSGSSGSF